MSSERPLAKQVALITGASRGIGRGIAFALARQGADLALVSRSVEGVDKVAEEIRAELPEARILTLAADVADPESASNLIKATVAEFERIDCLVNNAGITRDGLVLRMKDEDWDAVIDTNLKGTFNTCRAVAKQMAMRQRSGRIINVTSVVGLIGNVGQANYAASKGGVVALTFSLAKELASRGVTVNAVAPGFIETDMTDAMTDDAKGQVQASIPLGRLGAVDDIAGVVAFLCGPAAAYVTGEVIRVDGGLAIG